MVSKKGRPFAKDKKISFPARIEESKLKELSEHYGSATKALEAMYKLYKYTKEFHNADNRGDKKDQQSDNR